MNLRDLGAGMCIWHKQIPYRLVRNVWTCATSSKWIVQPLFVDVPERGLLIMKDDDFHLAKLHSAAA